MTINRIDGSGVPSRPDKSGGAQEPGAKPANASFETGDRIQLSTPAKERSSLAAAAAKLPVVRQEKIEALRREIDEGVYRVDAKLVARAILELEDVLGR